MEVNAIYAEEPEYNAEYYAPVFDAEYYLATNPDLKEASRCYCIICIGSVNYNRLSC